MGFGRAAGGVFAMGAVLPLGLGLVAVLALTITALGLASRIGAGALL